MKQITILIALTTFLLSTHLYAIGPIEDGLVAYWNFNDGTTNDQAVDSYNNVGILGGGASIIDDLDPSYAFEKTLALNGTDAYMYLPDQAELDFTDSFTIMLWIKPLSTGQSFILGKWHQYDATLRSYCLGANFNFPDDYEFQITPSGDTLLELTNSTNDDYIANVWQQLTLTFNGAEHRMAIYLDSSLIAMNDAITTETLNNTSQPLSFGAAYNDEIQTEWLFNGYMDEIKFFNRELTSDEIQQDYLYVLNGFPESAIPEPSTIILMAIGCLAYFKRLSFLKKS